MTGPLIILFIIINYLRKTLPENSPLRKWYKKALWALYVIPVLIIVDITLLPQSISNWLGHFIMLAIIAIAYTSDEFRSYRSFIIAFVPLVVVSFVDDVSKLGNYDFGFRVKDYTRVLYPASIVWMVALLIIANKQRKAIIKERKEREKEEAQSREVAARKVELEKMVAERTAELLEQKRELEHTLTELQTTQAQLIQSEKMASLGELTAGIAHEIQNPLNFVNNFAEVNTELLGELKQEIEKGDINGVKVIADDLKNNNEKIAYHGKRADSIVKGMLQHSRANTGQKEPTNINALTDEYLRLSYHGLRARDKSFNATIETNYDNAATELNIVSQDVGRVLLNLFNNAFYTVHEKSKQVHGIYKPTVWVATKRLDGRVEICVKDNGNGIPKKMIDKIYQPFFTTKPAGQGTGLGLSISYDIITKEHGGQINVKSKEGEGTEFIIQLPA